MSGLRGEVDALYNADVESQNVRILEYPVAFAGFNLVSNNAAGAGVYMAVAGNYGVAVPITTIPNPCWLIGVTLGLPVVEAFQADIRIGRGAIGAEIVLAEWACGTNVWAVVEWTFPTLYCKPIKILGSPRIVYDIRKSTAASLAGFNICHILVATGLGT